MLSSQGVEKSVVFVSRIDTKEGERALHPQKMEWSGPWGLEMSNPAKGRLLAMMSKTMKGRYGLL